MAVFISSTYKDLVEHREAVTRVLLRMNTPFSAMEFFGSRADEAVPACKAEIDRATIFVGIYAWRYGWQPSPREPSITEQEYIYARARGKPCLCYLVDPSYPWRPDFIDDGPAKSNLERLKGMVGSLVMSFFTTPDDLAKKIAADLSRELAPRLSADSFGGLLRINWDLFSPELQGILGIAYAQARRESTDGVVATRHVITAMANTPNTASALLASFPAVRIQPLEPHVSSPALHELFSYDKALSSCVLASMNRLLPMHTAAQRLLAIELAVDVLKHGSGASVAAFRGVGIDAGAVEKTVNHIKRIASDEQALQQALDQLNDAEIVHIAYLSNIPLPEVGLSGCALRKRVIEDAHGEGNRLLLVGELMRRYPRFVVVA